MCISVCFKSKFRNMYFTLGKFVNDKILKINDLEILCNRKLHLKLL